MINKKIKQNMVLSFGILAVLTFAILSIPTQANAQYGGSDYVSVIPYDRTSSNNNQYYNNNQDYNRYYYQSTMNNGNSAPANNSSTSDTTTIYSDTTNTNNTTAPKTVAKAKTTTPKTSLVAMRYIAIPANSTIVSSLPADATVVNETPSSSLTANAIFGMDSLKNLIPKNLVQWILFAILLLFIVILVRKVSGSQKKYHSKPMKHA